MKRKGLFIVLCVFCFGTAFGQNPFSRVDYNSNQPVLFDSLGNISDTARVERIESKIPPVTKNPRVDDVVWSKVVLRIIDLTDKQNYPLYFPLPKDSVATELNFFTLMYNKVLSKELIAYQDTVNLGEDARIVPLFTRDNICNPLYFLRSQESFKYFVNEDNGKISLDHYTLSTISSSVTKYLLQEIWYFDKNSSSFGNKIIAICPIYFDSESERATNLFWVPFDNLRVYMSQEMINATSRNNADMMTFDDFFAQREYTSYLFYDENVYDRTLQKYIINKEEAKREQARIEAEILNFEQDLWEY